MEEKYKVIATKVHPDIYDRIHKIARKKGLSVYQLNQLVIDTLVRYMDDRHNLTEDMEKAMSIFEHMSGWKGQFNWADPTADREIASAVYFVGDKKMKGMRAVLVEPYLTTFLQNENVQRIIEYVLCQLTPERYKRLRQLAVDLDCGSILELLDTMIDRQTAEEDLKMFRKEFEDANRSEYGKKPKEDGPYKRKHYKSVDLFMNESEDGNGI